MRVFQNNRNRVWHLLAIVCVSIAVQGLSPAGTEAQTTTRVSVSSAGEEANGPSREISLSADGRYVAFESRASNLVPGDTNGAGDIFVHDRQTGETTRVSVSSTGVQANSSSGAPHLSADGQIVAFDSFASNLVNGDTNGSGSVFDGVDVFVHDRQTGETTRVSVSSAGAEGIHSDDRIGLGLSADGRYVAFESYASNLVPGDTNGAGDIFVHDRQTGETTRVSVASGGGEADGFSYSPSLSADGQIVAFDSFASNLVNGDTNGSGSGFDGVDVFVHDRQTGETTRVSVSSAGAEGIHGDDSIGLGLSADGRYVAFESRASNLVPSDTNGTGDIFVHDRQTGETTRVSVASGGGEADGFSYSPSLSADGQIILFDSFATNLVPGDTNGDIDTFVHDRQTGETTRVSVSSAGVEAEATSCDCFEPALSGNGRVAAFTSNASNLVPGDTNDGGPFSEGGDIFVHDRGVVAIGNPNSSDINGDGRADFVWRNTTNGATHVWQMTAAGLRSPVTFPGGLPLNWVIQDVADVNGDGRADVVWRNTNNGATHVWQMTANGTRGPVTFPGGLPTNWVIQAVADVNGDGRADIIWRNTNNGATHVWQMTAAATRGPVTFPGGLPTNWVIQDVADVNGDGRADFIWRNTTNGATHVWQMTASGTRGAVTFPGGLPLNWVIQDVADVNGDGRADFIWRNTTNGATHVWQMTAAAARGPVTFPGGLPTNWQIQAVADVNGDGRADLIWRNMTNGATHVWQMTGGALRGPVTFPGGLPLNWELRP